MRGVGGGAPVSHGRPAAVARGVSAPRTGADCATCVRIVRHPASRSRFVPRHGAPVSGRDGERVFDG